MTEVDPRLTVIYDPEFIKKLKKLIEQDEALHIAPSKV